MFFGILQNICWITGAVFFYGISLIPPYYLINWSNTLPSPWFLFFYPAAVVIFLLILLISTGLFKTLLLPKPKPGEYDFPNSYQSIIWLLNIMVTQYLLVPFNRLVFLATSLRYLCLKLYGVKLHYTTMISTDTSVRDFDLLSIGKNSFLGGWAVVYGHCQPDRNKLVLARTIIGEECFFGAECSIKCGTTIGNNVFMGARCSIGSNSNIGNNIKIDYNTIIGDKATIEDNVLIGKNCKIGSSVQIKSSIVLPDFSTIQDDAIIDSQEQANSFSKISVENIL